MLEMREWIKIQIFHADFAMRGETGEPMAEPCNCLENFILKQKMQLVKVNSKSLMNFSLGILQILV